MSDDTITTTMEFRIRYAETDQMGIAHHSMYFWYMEMGRTELFREMGFRYSELERDGVLMPLIEANCRYLGPAYYDEELIMETTCNRVPSARYRLDYRIMRKHSGEVITIGHTIHAFQDRESRRPIRPPACFHFPPPAPMADPA